MWMINPELMCQKHIVGEHGEIHKHRHNFVKKHSIKGRIGQIEPKSMKERHDELALFLKNHNSPYTKPDISYLSEDELNSKVDPFQSITELKKRCPKCRGKISSRLRKLKEEYNQKVEELNKKYNEITERLQKGMRTKH